MYCINCGVELEKGEQRCPLCGTYVYHPDFDNGSDKRLFPSEDMPAEKVSRAGLMFVLTVLSSLPIIISLLCDLRINGDVTWSGYVTGSVLMLYAIIIFPIWFTNPNPVIFTPVDFTVIALFLLYINCKTGGHWFLTLALPICAAAAVLVTVPIVILKYVKKGKLYVCGGVFIATGLLCVLIELLIDVTFDIEARFAWSLYPLTAGIILGLTIITIAIVKPWREYLKRKFFI